MDQSPFLPGISSFHPGIPYLGTGNSRPPHTHKPKKDLKGVGEVQMKTPELRHKGHIWEQHPHPGAQLGKAESGKPANGQPAGRCVSRAWRRLHHWCHLTDHSGTMYPALRLLEHLDSVYSQKSKTREVGRSWRYQESRPASGEDQEGAVGAQVGGGSGRGLSTRRRPSERLAPGVSGSLLPPTIQQPPSLPPHTVFQSIVV